MVTLTIFTPTYNRKELLFRLYSSLKRQTNHEFIWLVIDDGSTDNTSEQIKSWIGTETQFEIRYVYKENGGLHTGYNKAIEVADTELCICIDSDDYMPDNAVERILDFCKENGSERFAGIIGLDYTMDGKCLGDYLPNQKSIDLTALAAGKYKIHNADRKMVVRTDLYKKYAPMPSYPGEKNFNPQYMHIQIGLEKEYLVMNECLCIVDYQESGMSNNIFRQYLNSPNSFADIRLLDLSLPNTGLKFKIKKSIHYCSSCFLAHRKGFIQASPHPMLALICVIPGYFLSVMIRKKVL